LTRLNIPAAALPMKRAESLRAALSESWACDTIAVRHGAAASTGRSMPMTYR
jgi:hypothetical protein